MEEGEKLAKRLEALQTRWSETPVTLRMADMAGGGEWGAWMSDGEIQPGGGKVWSVCLKS